MREYVKGGASPAFALWNPVEPGYKRVPIQPQQGGGLTYARATLDTPCGLGVGVERG